MADAFTRAGRPTSYGDLETLCYGSKGQPPDIRDLADALGLLDFAETAWLESEAADLDGGG